MSFRSWFLSVAAILLCFVAVLLLVTGFVVRAIRKPGFYETIPDPTLRVQETAFLSHNRACDVLIYGDSTALTGIDPAVITQQTGLSACNVATTRPVIDTLGAWPVDVFLQHNAKPRFLVLQFGPELFFRASDWDHNAGIAPLALLLRHQWGWETVKTMLTHPSKVMQVDQIVLKNTYFLKNEQRREFGRVYGPVLAAYQANGGMLNYAEKEEMECALPEQELYGPVDHAWVRTLREKYQTEGITVIVRAAPVPPCDPKLQEYRSALAPVVDSNVQTLPLSFFNNGDRHLTPAGAAQSTQDVVRLLQSHLQQR